MKTKLYSSKDPTQKTTIAGVIWTIITFPFWVIAGIGCMVCILIALIGFEFWDLIRTKK